jgi:site-specific DNA-methyltransferase (adenine-specific)
VLKRQEKKMQPDGMRMPSTVIDISNNLGSEGGKHPTQKPIALMEYFIKTYSNEGDLILDPFLGSGTTGIAAKNLDRKFIGIELDPEYFAIAQERIANAQPETGLFNHVA